MSAEGLLFLSFIGALLSLIPASIARGKGRSFLGFFIYGLCFWPAALIHSLIMESSKTTPIEKPETRDLTDDAYKLYLAEKYDIKRNDAFEKFVCDNKMFDSMDIALAHANRLEDLDLEAQKAQQKKDIVVRLLALGFIVTVLILTFVEVFL